MVMRIIVTHKSMCCVFGSLVALLLLGSAFLPCVAAQAQQTLEIEVYDSDTSNALQNDIVFEGKSYDIAIGTEEAIGFVVNVTISVLGETNITTNEKPFFTINNVSMNPYQSFVINASKAGYLPAERTLTVMKGALSISTTPPSSIEEKKEFQVTIKDQDGNPVEDALVFIDPNGTRVSTDAQGIAYLDAPEVSQNENIIIKTMKDDYINSSNNILVETVVPTIGDGFLIQIAPILFAAIAVIFAVLYVRWRKKTQKDLPLGKNGIGTPREDRPEDSKDLRKRPWEKEPAVYHMKERGPASISSSDSRVEEIRIPLQEKRKETTFLPAQDHPESPASHRKNEEDEWFKGQEYMRYKLDEMTGKIDQKNEGKWFEGERDIQTKVDEALKKQPKKKKDDQRDAK